MDVRLGRFPDKVDDSDQATNVVCANQVDGLGGRTKRRTGGGLIWSPNGKLLRPYSSGSGVELNR